MAVVAILWRIWRSRNWVVFEEKQFGIQVLMRQFVQQYEEWIRLPARSISQGPPPSSDRANTDSDPRMICRWDGATRRGSHSAGGMVLVYPTGGISLAAGVQFPVIDDPMVVELLVLREAVIWCSGLGLTDVRFEGDAKVIIDKLNRGDLGDKRMGAVLEEIYNCLQTQSGYSVRFVGWRSNRVAHMVARKALSLYSTISRSFDFQTWLNSRV
ncbi:unnamed protein product [Linum trigynum]|uniref:RNase H type-1 domain-containing protein n=1 Tax=Linum trigynum TaxID=586398 RepID=A0AAV2G5M5_9ROSI